MIAYVICLDNFPEYIILNDKGKAMKKMRELEDNNYKNIIICII